MDAQSIVPLTFLSFGGKATLYLIIVIILILFSAFFSMSETAYSSSADSKLRLLAEERKKGAKKAISLTEKFDKTLTVLLIGNNLVNVAISTLFVAFLADVMVNASEDAITWISTGVVTIVLLIFGEIFPKVIAKQHAEAIACAVSWPIYIIGLIFTPLTYVFYGFQKIITRKTEADTKMDEDELGVLIDKMEDDGSIEHDEATTIRKVFDLNDRSAEDIMVPRIKMEAIDYNSNLDAVKEFMLDNTFSRIPVYKKDKDHIVGILYERDFFPALVKNPKMSWRKLLRPVKYVSGAMKVDALIEELQASKTHMAIVSGEYGDVLGLVTMEDCLEEIVGEIYDEHDDVSEIVNEFVENEDGTYTVDADMYVEDMFERLGIGDVPEDVPSKLSGWIFAKCESLPEVGFSFDYVAVYTSLDEESGNYIDYAKTMTLKICEVVSRRITKVLVSLRDATEEEIENHDDENEE